MIHVDTLHLETRATVPEDHLRRMIRNDRRGYNTYTAADGRTYNIYDSECQGIYIKHTVENQKLKILIHSCSGFLHGNSMIPIQEAQVPQLIGRLQNILSETWRAELLLPIEEALVRRLDLKYDFQVGEAVVNDYLTAFARHTVPQHRKDILGNGDTVMFSNTSRTLKFYNRYANCTARKSPEEETEMSKGVIRFEAVCKTRELQSKLNMNRVNLSTILQSSITTSLLRTYLDIVNLEGVQICSERDLLEILKEQYGNPRSRGMLTYVQKKQANHMNIFSRSTQSKYEQLLRNAGVASVIGDRALPPLIADL